MFHSCALFVTMVALFENVELLLYRSSKATAYRLLSMRFTALTHFNRIMRCEYAIIIANLCALRYVQHKTT